MSSVVPLSSAPLADTITTSITHQDPERNRVVQETSVPQQSQHSTTLLRSKTEAAHSEQVKRVWDPLLTPVEAAELLRIHPKTALRLARCHGIPAIRLGKHWRFRTCDL
jgi:excisionase family DNA binding protein